MKRGDLIRCRSEYRYIPPSEFSGLILEVDEKKFKILCADGKVYEVFTESIKSTAIEVISEGG